MAPDWDRLRSRMVECQLRRRGIEDERVLAAMAEVPREEFVPEAARSGAYADSALPIGGRQTISQPWIVAAICQALRLRGGEHVLEIGTGSGYSAAVLSLLAGRVNSVERDPELASRAIDTLGRLGYDGIEVRVGDGSRGLSAEAPFDAIAVHATAPAPPRTLMGQLSPQGRLVAPIAADDEGDVLILFERRGDELLESSIGPCRFVPLVGEEGYEER
jgi:protein-L-isoaspartate(D-aspartate) O-methyltransferase